MSEEQFTSTSIRTYSGKYFDLEIMDPDTILIEDIAHSLSLEMRWGNHLSAPYTVAQHSVMVYRMVEKEHRLEALLHDATEAYLGDMPKPFKNLFPEFEKKEKELMAVIFKKFGLKLPLHKSIKKADTINLQLEWDSFVRGIIPLEVWSYEKAKSEFMKAYHECTKPF